MDRAVGSYPMAAYMSVCQKDVGCVMQSMVGALSRF